MFWCQINIAHAMVSLGVLLMTMQALVEASAARDFFLSYKLSPYRSLALPITTQPISRTPGSFEC